MRRPLQPSLPLACAVAVLGSVCVVALAFGASLVAGTVRLHALVHADPDADPFAGPFAPAPASAG
ncbi:hypothetical protein ACR8AL_03810 [Clavibacter sepedonicus]|nr:MULTISPECIES: hypothetical protein [Clavibacter]MBD5382183.1 hypothetical protein [Clavibacter sp.]OQJ48900.1 hypothetical protein B5P19_12065 [Clavibacter sepedonicus]OQJ53789.1 hypothetical protein B5P20_06385 [Clavibacter sepedonicus]UUK65298.1 hypothetical protein LRE50_13620 [Clavibacter sepedonicus]